MAGFKLRTEQYMNSKIFREEPRISEYGCLPRPPLLHIAPMVGLKGAPNKRWQLEILLNAWMPQSSKRSMPDRLSAAQGPPDAHKGSQIGRRQKGGNRVSFETNFYQMYEAHKTRNKTCQTHFCCLGSARCQECGPKCQLLLHWTKLSRLTLGKQGGNLIFRYYNESS